MEQRKKDNERLAQRSFPQRTLHEIYKSLRIAIETNAFLRRILVGDRRNKIQEDRRTSCGRQALLLTRRRAYRLASGGGPFDRIFTLFLANQTRWQRTKACVLPLESTLSYDATRSATEEIRES